MTWLQRTLDHLFTEPHEARTPGAGRTESQRRRRELEIEIEARRGVVGF